jgi:integrase
MGDLHMPWPKDRIPKYRKHRASGQAVVTLNGRDHYLGPHGTTASKLEYDRLIAEFLSSGRSATFGTPQNDITVVELSADYVRHAKAYYGTAPTSEYFRILRVIRPLVDLYGRTAAIEIGPLQLKAIRERLVGQELSRTYINECVRRIVGLFKWAAADGRIPAEVPNALAMVPGLRRGKTTAYETAPVVPVGDETVDATLPHMSPIAADMVRLQRLTGMRPAEVCIVRPCDIDRTGDVWVYRPHSHKTMHHGRDRVIPLT